MADHVFARRTSALGGVLFAMAALAGCQSGNGPGALDLGGLGAGKPSQEQSDDKLNVRELLAFCPPVTLRADQSISNVYARGGDGNPEKLIRRSWVTDATRTCDFNNGVMAMKIAVAGRIVPGPAASVGTIEVPIRVTVVQGTEEIYSKQHLHQVAIADTAGATQFMFIDSGFSMPNPTTRNIRVFIGLGPEDGDG